MSLITFSSNWLLGFCSFFSWGSIFLSIPFQMIGLSVIGPKRRLGQCLVTSFFRVWLRSFPFHLVPRSSWLVVSNVSRSFLSIIVFLIQGVENPRSFNHENVIKRMCINLVRQAFLKRFYDLINTSSLAFSSKGSFYASKAYMKVWTFFST